MESDLPESDSFICPGCANTAISVYYTSPPLYECRRCNYSLIDDNAKPGVRSLSVSEARTKRPGLFGLKACPVCNHGIHESGCHEACKWCQPEPEHVYKFRLGYRL